MCICMCVAQVCMYVHVYPYVVNVFGVFVPVCAFVNGDVHMRVLRVGECVCCKQTLHPHPPHCPPRPPPSHW